jgi:hypothetical protein
MQLVANAFVENPSDVANLGTISVFELNSSQLDYQKSC